MASRRNAKQSDIESVEKLAETGQVLPPKRTKIVKSSIEKLKDTKSTKSAKNAKVSAVENNNEIIENELITVKKLRTRNKAEPSSTAKLTAIVQPIQEQTAKLKHATKKSKLLTEDNKSSNNSNGLVDKPDNGISEKITTKKTRAKKVPEKAGNTSDNNVEDAKGKPNTRANKVGTLKDDKDSVSVEKKEKEKKKNATDKVPKEIKTKVKQVKKVVENNEAVVEEKKKKVNTRAKTTENNTKAVKSTVNDQKKAKAQTSRKMRGQTDSVLGETENNVEETNNSKPVKGKQRKTNKDNATIETNNLKKANTKVTVLNAVNKKINELETDELKMEEEEEKEDKEKEEEEEEEEAEEELELEEEEEEEIMKIKSKKSNLQKTVTNTNNGSLNSEENSVDLNSSSNKNN